MNEMNEQPNVETNEQAPAPSTLERITNSANLMEKYNTSGPVEPIAKVCDGHEFGIMPVGYGVLGHVFVGRFGREKDEKTGADQIVYDHLATANHVAATTICRCVTSGEKEGDQFKPLFSPANIAYMMTGPKSAAFVPLLEELYAACIEVNPHLDTEKNPSVPVRLMQWH
jgi:hypothetical protein